MFFFCCGPFARAPRHWFLENFLLSAPGVQSVFFVALRWAPRPFGGARAKTKKTTQGVFFFCSGPGERQGKEKPPCRHGAKAKKTPPRVVFFAAAPAKGKGRRSPVGRRHGARANKKHRPGCFFCSGPGKRQGKEKPAPNGASPSPAFPRGRSKKKHPGWCFFLAAAPRGRSLTHCGPGGWCFFFFCCGPARTGVVFFFLLWPRPDAHCGLGRFRLGPGDVFCFFCCGPAGSF